MKKNEHYFPSMEFVKNASGEWEKHAILSKGSEEDRTGKKELGSETMDEGSGEAFEEGA